MMKMARSRVAVPRGVRVQIFAPIAGGPLTQYVAYLIPALRRLVDTGAIGTIGVTLARSHYESAYFREYLQPYADDIDWDVFDDEVASMTWRSGLRCAGALVRSVDRLRPQYLISVSSNYGALALALRSVTHPYFRRSNTKLDSIGIVHHGIASDVRGTRDRLRRLVHRATRDLAPWSELHVVNPLLFDAIRSGGARNAARVRLLPHPLPRSPIEAKPLARERLGIEREGRYVAYVGKSDPRKAIPELLTAFRAARLEATDRLLIAGPIHPPYRTLIDRRYGDLIASGRLVLLDRYLADGELHAAFGAADVVAIPYYPMDDLSANLLAAVAADRPVLANDYGYAGDLIRRFELGWACDIAVPDSFATTLARAVRESDRFELDDRARRLVAYHDPANYADIVLTRLYARLGHARSAPKTWEWVVGL